MLRLKLFLKHLFNALLPKRARNAILRACGRDYELSQNDLERLSCNPNKSTEQGDFIVALTTFPARLSTLKYTFYSIFAQDLYPKKIVLCLSIFEFDKANLPREIRDFEAWGVEILWSEENIRQYNKIIPVLRAYPSDVIITIDDDIFYPNGLFRALWEAHKREPHIIWTHRARIIACNEKNVESFYKWKLVKKNHQVAPSQNLFLEGVGGVLYPPNSLHSDVCEESKFMNLSPKADDIWLWAMAVLRGSKIGVVANNLMANGNMMTISPYLGALWSDNQAGGNDTQMQAMLRAYPQLLNILRKGNS